VKYHPVSVVIPMPYYYTRCIYDEVCVCEGERERNKKREREKI